MNDNRNILPGDRVLVFDRRLYKDDKSTPISVTVKPATVVCRYGKKVPFEKIGWSEEACRYPDLVDVVFDHRPGEVSRGHFTTSVELIKNPTVINV